MTIAAFTFIGHYLDFSGKFHLRVALYPFTALFYPMTIGHAWFFNYETMLWFKKLGYFVKSAEINITQLLELSELVSRFRLDQMPAMNRIQSINSDKSD